MMRGVAPEIFDPLRISGIQSRPAFRSCRSRRHQVADLEECSAPTRTNAMVTSIPKLCAMDWLQLRFTRDAPPCSPSPCRASSSRPGAEALRAILDKLNARFMYTCPHRDWVGGDIGLGHHRPGRVEPAKPHSRGRPCPPRPPRTRRKAVRFTHEGATIGRAFVFLGDRGRLQGSKRVRMFVGGCWCRRHGNVFGD